MSETLNSNSINAVAGIALPAALGGLTAFANVGLVWLVGVTAGGARPVREAGRGGRTAGGFLVALYAVFVVVQVTVSVRWASDRDYWQTGTEAIALAPAGKQ